MGRIVLVTGGCRSGKSAHAQRLALGVSGRRAYLATCPAIDDEMARRIERHRLARDGQGWVTVEEPLDLAGALVRLADFDVVLVDCITLWINNLQYQAQQNGGTLGEDELVPHCDAVLAAAEACRGTVIFVTNEVGLGIVPHDAQTRRYRDLVGRAGQAIAARAASVVFVCAGIPLVLKPWNRDTVTA